MATKWNSTYWNTACLVVNSGSLEEADTGKKKKGTDYIKTAKAINEIIEQGINLSLININTSDYSFKPDAQNNRILYGLKAVNRINDATIEKIKAGRPYTSIADFMARCSLTKPEMVNLIKAGAFDELDKVFNSRKKIMAYYISRVYDEKKRLTLQNFNGLIQKGLVPKDLEMQIRIFNLNKYLKQFAVGQYYTLNNSVISFFDRFLSDESDKLETINTVVCIKKDKWEKIYKRYMDDAREWIKANQETLLMEYNHVLFKEMWDKYALGNLSHWEMESLCFYYHEHELANVSPHKYGLVDFNQLNPNGEVDYFYKRGKNNIPIYKLSRIIGTVIAKNDTKSIVTILTPTGVVDVKFTREYYAMFKKQISDIGADGEKHVMEKGWFTRGNMIMVTGFRRDDIFIGKIYKNTAGHQLYRITNVLDDEIKLQHERFTSATATEEDEYED